MEKRKKNNSRQITFTENKGLRNTKTGINSGRVSSSCSTSDTPGVSPAKNPVASHEGRKICKSDNNK